MFSLIEGFLLPCTTTRAILTGIRRVDLDRDSTSFFRFVDREGPDQSPGSVSDALRQTMVLNHALDVQGFKHDNATAIHEPTRNPVREIQPLVSDLFMGMRDRQSSSSTFRGSLRFFREPSLNSFEISFSSPKETRILHNLTPIGREEIFQTSVQPDRDSRRCKPLGLYLDGKTHEPLARRGSRDRRGLDLTLDRTMQIKSDLPDPPDLQDRTFQNSTAWVLGPAQTIVPKTIPEPRVASLFLRLPTPTKESLESTVHSVLRVPQDLAVDFFQLGFILFPAGQEFVGVVQTNPGLRRFPRIFPDLQGFVVNPTAEIDPSIQAGGLSLGTVQSVSVCFNRHLLEYNVVKGEIFMTREKHALHPQP